MDVYRQSAHCGHPHNLYGRQRWPVSPPPPLLSLNLARLFLLFQRSESQSVNLVAVCQLPTKHRPDSLLTAPWSLASPHRFSLHVTSIKSKHPSPRPKEMSVISCSAAAASPYEVVPQSCCLYLIVNFST